MTTRMPRQIFSVAIVLGLCQAGLAAQQPQPPADGPSRLFGDVAVMTGWDTEGTRDGPALGLGLGVHLSRVKTVRFELKVPKRNEIVSGQPGANVYVRERTRIASYSLLAARHFGSHIRPHVEFLVGISGMLYSSTGTSTFRLKSVNGLIREWRDEFDDAEGSVAFTSGLDVVIPFRRRIDLVPQVRADWVVLGGLIRVGMTVRTHF
jgi:hypothetical protein